MPRQQRSVQRSLAAAASRAPSSAARRSTAAAAGAAGRSRAYWGRCWARRRSRTRCPAKTPWTPQTPSERAGWEGRSRQTPLGHPQTAHTSYLSSTSPERVCYQGAVLVRSSITHQPSCLQEHKSNLLQLKESLSRHLLDVTAESTT